MYPMKIRYKIIHMQFHNFIDTLIIFITLSINQYDNVHILIIQLDQQRQEMDIFEFPDDYKPQKYLTSEQMQEIESYLKNHPLFMKQLPKDVQNNEHLQALIQLKTDQNTNQIAQNLNKQANKKLKDNPNGVYQMKDAYQKYTQAIHLKCSDLNINAKLHANRAQLNLKLKNYGKVIIDCKQCLKYNPQYTKGYYRYAKALIALQKYEQCLKILSNRTEQQLQQLYHQSKTKSDNKKLHQQKKNNEKQQKTDQLKKYCQKKGWKYIKRIQPLPQGIKLQIINQQLSIPILIYYPEFRQVDVVESSFQDQMLSDHLYEIIRQGIPWDYKHEYQIDSIEVYAEIQEAVLLKIVKDDKIGQILKKVPLKEVLQFQVVRKDNPFYESYITQYKMI